VAAHLDGGQTGPPGKYQAAINQPVNHEFFEWPKHLKRR